MHNGYSPSSLHMQIRFIVTAQQITETGGKPITNYIVHTKRSQCNELE